MFQIEVEKETFALKPMNCPGHWCGRWRPWAEGPGWGCNP
jgi:hypothetical protein